MSYKPDWDQPGAEERRQRAEHAKQVRISAEMDRAKAEEEKRFRQSEEFRMKLGMGHSRAWWFRRTRDVVAIIFLLWLIFGGGGRLIQGYLPAKPHKTSSPLLQNSVR